MPQSSSSCTDVELTYMHNIETLPLWEVFVHIRNNFTIQELVLLALGLQFMAKRCWVELQWEEVRVEGYQYRFAT